MKTASVLFAIIASSLALPLEDSKDLKRDKSSLSLGAPRSGGGYLAPAPLHVLPQYRELDHENEEHQRSYYEPAAGAVIPAPHSVASYGSHAGIAISAGAGQPLSLPAIAAPIATGPAIGVFPHARVSGCNVPLMLSCAPNVVTGVLSEHHGYAAPAYRNADEDMMREADWVKASRAANHHKLSEDIPESQTGKHHTDLKDLSEPNLTRTVPKPENEQVAHAEHD
ncbi:unnamed protein product [Chilo suppressalis]|uniref:Uncharacterized protein n=1 Tax=Chilo suppressalis TaxID=168631 RepID=A0ABN8BC66_CHISP|nr:unnamed protein product [Chilo suppressalis]